MPANAPPSKKLKPNAAKPKVLKLGSPTTATKNKAFNPLTAYMSQPQTQPPANSKPLKPQTAVPTSKGKGKEKVVDPGPMRTSVDDALWVDLYEPKTEAELAVHTRKVEEVRRWLGEAFDGGPSGKLVKYRKVLVLTGPAGAAKTTTLRVLSTEMGFDIMEWRNSFEEFSANTEDGYESMFTKFHNFMNRATSCNNTLFSSKSTRNQVVLLEDLPNILHHDTRAKFHSIIESLAAFPASSPVVIVVSDAGVRGEGDGDEGSARYRRDTVIDVRTVIPKSLLGGPYVTEVKFNPIAPTLMRKALQAMLTRHFSPPAPSKAPSKEVLDAIVESASGDIRSAVMSLQFACVSGGGLGSVGRTKKSRGPSARSMLEVVTKREQSLVLFHLLGKIMYNKRKGDPPSSSASSKEIQREQDSDEKLKDPPKLPTFLQDHNRPASRVDVDMLYADSPIDSSLLSLYIHQNYAQFCNEVEEYSDIAEWLSWADSSGGEMWYQSNPHRFHLLTLGTLHSLPTPVTRRSQKFYKPYFFESLAKEQEASFAIRRTQDWLSQADSSLAHSRAIIATELGSVLKGRAGLPPSHGLYANLPFAHGAGHSQVLQDGETVPDDALDAYDELHSAESEDVQQNGGWLDGDDIEDF